MIRITVECDNNPNFDPETLKDGFSLSYIFNQKDVIGCFQINKLLECLAEKAREFCELQKQNPDIVETMKERIK